MLRIAALLSLLSLVACDGGPVPPGADSGVDMSIFPVAPGLKWTYRVTSGAGEVAEKVQTVTGTIAYEGRSAFRFETQRVGLKEAVSIQAVEGDRVVRLEEWNYENQALVERDRYVPFGVRVDRAKITAGDTYQDQHDKEILDEQGNVITKKRVIYNFFVEAGAELVEVPAGRLPCVRVRREEVGKDSSKTYWYSPGIGKVKEIGGQTEELLKLER